MLEIYREKTFRKDYKRVKKRGKYIQKLKTVIELLVAERALPANCHDHFLKGNYASYRECHIEPDWLLIYRIEEGEGYT